MDSDVIQEVVKVLCSRIAYFVSRNVAALIVFSLTASVFALYILAITPTAEDVETTNMAQAEIANSTLSNTLGIQNETMEMLVDTLTDQLNTTRNQLAQYGSDITEYEQIVSEYRDIIQEQTNVIESRINCEDSAFQNSSNLLRNVASNGTVLINSCNLEI